MKRLIPSSLASTLAAACAVFALGGCVAYPSGPGYGYSGGYYDDGYGQPYGAVPAYGYAEPPPVQSSLFLGFGGGGSDYNRGYWGRGYDHDRGYHGNGNGNGNWNGNRGQGGGGPHGPPQGSAPMQPGGNSGGGHGMRPPVQAGGGQPQAQPQPQQQGGGNRGGGRYVSPGEARNAGGGTLH